MEITVSLSITQSPEMIWNFWMPVTTDVQWRDGIIKAEWTSKPPYGVGSTGVHIHNKFGGMPWTIIKWEEHRHMEWIHRDSKIKGSVASYHVEPEDGGSCVTIYTKMTGPFPMRIIMFFMKRKMIKGLESELQKLKEIMEK